MKPGIDYPGTVVKYLACYKNGTGCDGNCEIYETLEGAKRAIEGMKKRRKSIKYHGDQVSFWIMKQTLTAEKVWPEGNEDDYEKAKNNC